MEYRSAVLITNRSGGNASKSSNTYRVTLPNTWIEALNLNEQNKNLELSFDGKRIIVEPKTDTNDYINNNKNHKLIKLEYYNLEVLQTTIVADYTEKRIVIKNHTNDIIHLAFGVDETPDWNDYNNFLSERCIPKTREGIEYYLDALGLYEYEPIDIIKRTQGRMDEDHQWIKVTEI